MDKKIELIAACRRAHVEFSGALDLHAVAVGYELARSGDTQLSAFIQRALTVIAWGLPLDDETIARLAGRNDVPAYLPHGQQDRYVASRHGREVLVRHDSLTPFEAQAVQRGREEITRLGLWNDPTLAPVLNCI